MLCSMTEYIDINKEMKCSEMKGCGTQGVSNYIGLISGNNYETKAGATEETKF